MEGSRKNALLELLVDVRRVAAHDEAAHSRLRNGEMRQLTAYPYCSADVSFITLSTYRRYQGLRDHRSSVSSRDTAR